MSAVILCDKSSDSPCMQIRYDDRNARCEYAEPMKNIEKLLSPAEREVLVELLDGLTNVQIAKALRLSSKTIKNHISHILVKTDSATRLELTVKCYKARERELRRRLRAAA